MRPNPGDWQRLPIVSLCEAHVDCVNRTAPVVIEPTPFKMLRTTNVRNGYVDAENVRCVTEETYKRWTRRLVPRRGDIIMTREAPLGDVGKIRTDEAVFLGQRLYHFRPDPQKLDADFLLYSLLGDDLQSQIRRFGSGSTVEHMRLEDIPSLEFSVPSLPIQRRIAGILSAYDELIENSQRRIKVLELMARALYREWFVHFRFPGRKSVPSVPSPLGEIPQGWEVRKVRQIAGLVSRGPSLTYVDSDGIQVVNQRCIRNGEIEMQAVQYAMPLSEKKAHLYLKPHDVLINSMGVGTLGRVSRNLTVDEPTIIHNCITVVRAKPDEPTTAYLYYRLSDSQEHFESLGIGATGQTSLRIETIEDVQIALPPRQILESFEEAVLPMWSQIGYLKREIQTLRRTRDLLLPRLISGELDVEASAT